MWSGNLMEELNKANLRDLIAATGLVILLKFDPNHRFFSPCVLEIWWMTSKIFRAHLLYYIKLCASNQILLVNSNWSYSLEMLHTGLNWWFFVLCDLEIWWMTLENNRAPHLYYIKVCASFHSHGWIQTGVTVRKRSIRVKISDFLSRVTLKFDGWPSTRQIWGIWKLRPAYSPETPNLGQNRWCFVPCDLEIWWMTLENNRASLLCRFKLCATFHSHRWIQTGVTVLKRPIFGSNSMIFLAVWPWNLTDDLQQGKSEGFDSCDRPSNLTQIGLKSLIFQPVWPWNLMDDPE